MLVREFGVCSLPPDWSQHEYDVFITTIGYEGRARYIAERFRPKADIKVACGFRDQQVLEYSKNCEWFGSNEFDVAHEPDSGYAEWARTVLERVPEDRLSIRVLVDISSMTRFRIATLLVSLREARQANLSVSFVYSLASFTPPQEMSPANTHVGPVTAEFAGWWEEPDRALAAVVGLGYEADKALGAVEHLQAAEVWTFSPTSAVEAYSPALTNANRALLEGIPQNHQLSYRVEDPLECLARLESLTFGLTHEKNPILIPFGPKVFALCSLLVSMWNPTIPVWRVSAESHEVAVNRQASGLVYGLRVIF